MTLYKPRPIRFLELMDGKNHGSPGWKAKLYGVTAREGADSPRQAIIAAAKTVAFDTLPKPAIPAFDGTDAAVAVVCAHEANGADFVLVGRWAGSNELHTSVHLVDVERPELLLPAGSSETPLCTWDLAILAFEREAWIERVLKNPTPAGIEAYLSHVLNTIV